MPTSKSMPANGSNVSDRTSSFILGRRAYNFSSHNPSNVNKNIDYSSVLGKPSSIVYGKPLNNIGNDLRIQRLRLTTIGVASMRIKASNDYVHLNGKNQDINLINNVLSRVRGGGSIVSKKGQNDCTFCV
uniref:Uncharacterized protein n=1 Tax=viral metagenome TaxID=1070528 RepID=A0A6C0H4D2_9ZZZZ